MREVGGVHMRRVTDHFARRYAFVGDQPRFVVPRLHRLVQSALRSVESGRRPWWAYRRFLELITRAIRLQSGLFCGRRRPMVLGNFCSICQSNDAGDWWLSMRCNHHFHVMCIFAHLDTRCPLCRAQYA